MSERAPFSSGKVRRVLPAHVVRMLTTVVIIVGVSASAWYFFVLRRSNIQASIRIQQLEVRLQEAQRHVDELESTDFVKKNQELTAELKDTKTTLTAQLKQKADDDAKVLRQMNDSFVKVATLYERLVDLKEGAGKRSPLDKLFASIMRTLADQKISDAETALRDLETKIAQAEAVVAVSGSSASANIPVKNALPASGYSRQKVHIDAGDFVVSIVSADLNSAKVIVDTASDSTCGNNCPVLPLATFVSRSGAFAGINGIYFCPESYPSCVGKTNSFDQLVMNKNKVYFNSDDNVYSQNPVAIFGAGSSVRFLNHAQDWGRDTSVDSVISNHPPLLLGGQVLAATTDPKLTSRGYRGFIGHKGSTAYMGFVHGATTAEGAQVLKAMGLEDALNLDSGGSTALWSGGYKLGPGRNLPMAILFVRR